MSMTIDASAAVRHASLADADKTGGADARLFEQASSAGSVKQAGIPACFDEEGQVLRVMDQIFDIIRRIDQAMPEDFVAVAADGLTLDTAVNMLDRAVEDLKACRDKDPNMSDERRREIDGLVGRAGDLARNGRGIAIGAFGYGAGTTGLAAMAALVAAVLGAAGGQRPAAYP